MKLIDGKGRVFGKINLIDLFIVVFIAVSILLLAASYYKFDKRKYKTEDVMKDETIVVKIETEPVPIEIARAIKAGDKDIKSTGSSWSVMEGVEFPESAGTGVRKNISLILTIKMSLQSHLNEYIFRGQLLKLNRYIVFATSDYEITGRIISMKVLNGQDTR